MKGSEAYFLNAGMFVPQNLKKIEAVQQKTKKKNNSGKKPRTNIVNILRQMSTKNAYDTCVKKPEKRE